MNKQILIQKNQPFPIINNKRSNPCIRCGKERIDSKSWEETITNFLGKSVITYTDTVCPDLECQKILEKEWLAQKKRREEYEHIKEERKAEFKRLHKKQSIVITAKKRVD